ncbi:MAG: DegV family protein [Chloroflexota bacterium]|nr:DegV family protein [Chloroflexota bacterium]
MHHIAILTDSVSCLPDKLRREYSIQVIPLHVNFGSESHLDGVEMSMDEFYHRLREADPLPTTSAPSVGEYLTFYRQMAEEGAEAIICIPYGRQLGMGYGTALTAAQQMEEIDIRVVDSGTGLMAEGFLALEAARAAAAGATVQEIMDRIQELIPRVYVLITMDTLEYLRRGGRIGEVQALLGSVLRIKPLIQLRTDKGRLEPLGRSHTRSRALRDLVNHMARVVGDRPVHVAVHQGACKPEEVEWLTQAVEERFDCRELYQTGITPVIGTHTGPGTLALSFWAE